MNIQAEIYKLFLYGTVAIVAVLSISIILMVIAGYRNR